MAFDGITVSAITNELNNELSGGRIAKIAQPENDELILTIKTPNGQRRLFMSADPSLPLIYLMKDNKTSPLQAPGFCMLLRKYLQNAKIISFEQPALERVIRINLEHFSEMGDLKNKVLIIELMGKHSNIILLDENEKIVDSIKRVSGLVSSVREVLPGKDYFIPTAGDKKNPLVEIKENFLSESKKKNGSIYKCLYMEYMGLSPMIAQEICNKANVDSDIDVRTIPEEMMNALWESFFYYIKHIIDKEYRYFAFYENGEPREYAVMPISSYAQSREYENVSDLLVDYYAKKNAYVRIRQKSSNLRKIVANAIERAAKKLDLQKKQLDDTKKREQYKLFGELLNAYGYQIEAGVKKAKVLNYYTNEEIVIPLDENLTIQENAKRYYDKYGKLKRTYEAMQQFVEETSLELEHLNSIMMSLNIAIGEEDLIEIKQELIECGYIRGKNSKEKKVKITSKPFHYISSGGFDMYVGKNNYQNDELTFKFAGNKDWWFHAKKVAGSHVIVKTNGKELPDKDFEEAAALAAYYSSVKEQGKVEVDYVQRKEVKKPPKAAPGYVIYHTNYSMIASTDISLLHLVE